MHALPPRCAHRVKIGAPIALRRSFAQRAPGRLIDLDGLWLPCGNDGMDLARRALVRFAADDRIDRGQRALDRRTRGRPPICAPVTPGGVRDAGPAHGPIAFGTQAARQPLPGDEGKVTIGTAGWAIPADHRTCPARANPRSRATRPDLIASRSTAASTVATVPRPGSVGPRASPPASAFRSRCRRRLPMSESWSTARTSSPRLATTRAGRRQAGGAAGPASAQARVRGARGGAILCRPGRARRRAIVCEPRHQAGSKPRLSACSATSGSAGSRPTPRRYPRRRRPAAGM